MMLQSHLRPMTYAMLLSAVRTVVTRSESCCISQARRNLLVCHVKVLLTCSNCNQLSSQWPFLDHVRLTIDFILSIFKLYPTQVRSQVRGHMRSCATPPSPMHTSGPTNCVTITCKYRYRTRVVSALSINSFMIGAPLIQNSRLDW